MSLKHEPILGVTVHQHTVIAERLLKTFCPGKSMKVNDMIHSAIYSGIGAGDLVC